MPALLTWLDAQVYHPNIDLDGNVCLNILREDWKPVLSISSIIYGLQFLFLVRITVLTAHLPTDNPSIGRSQRFASGPATGSRLYKLACCLYFDCWHLCLASRLRTVTALGQADLCGCRTPIQMTP